MILLELMIGWASGRVNSQTCRGRPHRRYKPAGHNYVFGQWGIRVRKFDEPRPVRSAISRPLYV